MMTDEQHSPGWLAESLPGMTSAEAFGVVERLMDAGYDFAYVNEHAAPHLPRIAAALLRQDARAPVEQSPEAGHRVASGDYAPCEDLLLDLVEDHVFVVGDQVPHAVLMITRDGELRTSRLLEDAPLTPSGVAAILRNARSDRFAIVTGQFTRAGDINVLFGCPTQRIDLLRTTVRTTDARRLRSPWRECSCDSALNFLIAVMSEFGMTQLRAPSVWREG